ncbi:hypothetical protein RUMHYD_00679 [Blautia hydrogenotrophica DSM 10507]|uniref:Uncharacterized protein n=1 Tax=Blautia hydrogenotrophica (strain DSM 10507 / JCM 14656 / S5a33) TaxID=476272 RepID=C0CIL5_BLAHS|nr:hypothetical protein RUMHYD_00679 [Blautia hydrogenotrophica DSM 10507]
MTALPIFFVKGCSPQNSVAAARKVGCAPQRLRQCQWQAF